MHIAVVESVSVFLSVGLSVCVTAKKFQLGYGWADFVDVLYKYCNILTTPSLKFTIFAYSNNNMMDPRTYEIERE
jgi:hypothetical protein